MKHLVKILSLGAALVASPLAHATLISIGLQQAGVAGDGGVIGAVKTVATDSGTGQAIFSGSFGTFTFSNITAQGAPALPQGTLSSNSIQTTATAASTITVYITQQGLTSPQGLASVLSSFTSNLFLGTGTVVESSLGSNANALFAGTQMASATFTGNGGGSGLGTNLITTPVNIAGTYSMTEKYVITLATAGSVNDTIVVSATAAPTPEPSSLIMLGTGLMSAAGMLVRRRKIS